MTTVVIAAAVKTPLYLPLYIAEAHHFFELHSGYEFRVEHSQPGESDADRWACEQVFRGSADFAICDPTKSTDFTDTSVVASIIARAAFWAVCKYPRVNNLEEFSRFSTTYTYPEGMSAHNIAEAIAHSIGSNSQVVPREVGSELQALLEDADNGSVAITADLVAAIRFTETYRAFAFSADWCRHPTLGNLMLTGLLTSDNTIHRRYSLVTQLIRALNRAAGIARVNTEVAATVLQQMYLSGPEQLSLAEAESVVSTLNRLRIYPVSPVPDPSGWHNTVVVQKAKQLFVAEGPGSDSRGVLARCKYQDYVDAKGAEETEEDVVRLFAAFGAAGLNFDIIRSIQELTVIDLPKIRVVGECYRADEKHRNVLREHARQITESVVRNGSSAIAYCVWGGSGSGKTIFVKSIGAAHSDIMEFVYIHVGVQSLAAVEDELAKLKASTRPTLVAIDEIDSEKVKSWACDRVFSQLDQQFPQPITFVVIGSRGESLDDWVTVMSDKAVTKGEDLITRIGPNRISVPASTLPDRAAIVASTLHAFSRNRDVPINKIEKLALYFLLISRGMQNLRQQAKRIERSVPKISPESDKLLIEDLFTEAEREERLAFYLQHYDAGAALIHRYIEIVS